MASSKLLSLALFLLLLTHATATTFDFPTFHKEDKNRLILQGNATISSGGRLRLTGVGSNEDPRVDSMGRAFYSTPIQIRDSTGNLASFDNKFTFIIRANNAGHSAYGLAFALVPVGSEPKRKQEYLGLFPDAHTVVWCSTPSATVLKSTSTPTRLAQRGFAISTNTTEKTDVQITYESPKKNLRVVLHFTNSNVKYDFNAPLYLENDVDRSVSVGFSATSGLKEETTETHDVLSWSFSSKFEPFYVKDQKSEGSNILLNQIL
uniref:Arcelin n=1 Tax=Phaseolus acutifolius TaxID=33129 RepID=Q40748_PHAAT|nr:arcelin [Phaseolus acutifolius]